MGNLNLPRKVSAFPTPRNNPTAQSKNNTLLLERWKDTTAKAGASLVFGIAYKVRMELTAQLWAAVRTSGSVFPTLLSTGRHTQFSRWSPVSSNRKILCSRWKVRHQVVTPTYRSPSGKTKLLPLGIEAGSPPERASRVRDRALY